MEAPLILFDWDGALAHSQFPIDAIEAVFTYLQESNIPIGVVFQKESDKSQLASTFPNITWQELVTYPDINQPFKTAAAIPAIIVGCTLAPTIKARLTFNQPWTTMLKADKLMTLPQLVSAPPKYQCEGEGHMDSDWYLFDGVECLDTNEDGSRCRRKMHPVV